MKMDFEYSNMMKMHMKYLVNCSNLFSGNTNLTGNATAMIESLQKITTLTNHEKAFEGCT